MCNNIIFCHSYNCYCVDDKKRRYAEKMANAHLKSAGMGEYTPLPKRQSGGSHGDGEVGPSSRWKPRSSCSEDDDFDF